MDDDGRGGDDAERETRASKDGAPVVAEGVRKRYGDVEALAGVSLSVAAGEVFGLIGPNGAGKTTLVRALTGTTRADGKVRLFGAPPDQVDPARIGLLPQSFSPPERLTARELAAYYGGLYDDPRPPDDVLSAVGLADDAAVRYDDLSGGQKRRLCVATALVNDPDLLFVDEPTTGIDPAGRRALWRLVEDLADGGTTVFLTSHSMREVERLADRVGLLADGDLVAVGRPRTLIDEHGGDSRLVVRLRDPAAARGAADAVSRPDEPDRFDPSAEGDRLVFEDVSPVAIGDAVAALDAAGIDYESLAWREPGLEEVFLRLSGETFAGGGGTLARTGSGTRRAVAAGTEVDATDDSDPPGGTAANGGDGA